MASSDGDRVVIHTDGACLGNPGPGGWAAILSWRGRERVLTGGEPITTNNRMELMAAIAGLEALTRSADVRLVTDSAYVRNGIMSWLPVWRRRGWRTADNKPVLNRDLWERLEAAAARHRVEWAWTRGHAGDCANERADALARAAAEAARAAAPPLPAAP